jgi:outer membrane protein TolC
MENMNIHCKHKYVLSILITLCTCCNVKAYSQVIPDISLANVVNKLSLQSPASKKERLNFENELLLFENFKKGFLPAVSINMSPFSFNRSIVKLQQANDGQYNYVEDYSGSSSAGLSIQQKVPFTGGTLSMSSNLNYLHEMSQNRHSFSSTPFSMSYSQQIFGSAKTMWMEKNITYKKNEETIKKYCSIISGIQQKALGLFMDAFLASLEMELSLSNKLATDSLLGMAKIKYQNKRITEADFKQIELQATNNEYLKESAKKNYQDAIRNLVTYLGLTDYFVAVKTPEFTLPLQISLESVKYYIIRNNPKALSSEIRRLEAQKNLYSSELQNKFNANINLSYGMNQFASNLADVYSSPSRQQSVSLTFSIPFSLWGINRNKAIIAKNSYNSALIEIEQELNEFENEIQKKVNNYNHNVNLWLIAERSYQLAQEQYKLVIIEFSMGKSSAYELISSQQEQSAAMQKYYNAIKDAWDSYFKLREMTLYDFEKKMELRDIFLTTDFNNGELK